ncbi:MAG: class I SAM-dependent methyltransferase [Armatimonadota bacterium]|nr:class I SAM-dependent methyltransferase [Armatimonadota bacterium]
MRRNLAMTAFASVSLAAALLIAHGHCKAAQPEVSFGPFVPTPMPVVEEMLKLANVTKDDIVYDLGCGDGRIVIMAAKKYGAKGVGIDIDPELIEKCKEGAEREGVSDRVRFIAEDAMKSDVSDATVVTLYVLPSAMLKLRPKLLRELKPGVRIVSHNYSMGDWEADKVVNVNVDYQRTLYYWVVPAGVAGIWRWRTTINGKAVECTLKLKQEFQKLSGTLSIGEAACEITNGKVTGNEVSFSATIQLGGREVKMTFNGKVSGDALKGTQLIDGTSLRWDARRAKVGIEGRWKWVAKTPDGELTGQLTIGRDKRGIPLFSLVSDGTETAIWDSYLWGACVRFSVKLWSQKGERELTFSGFVEGETIVGEVACDAWETKGEWRAEKMSK